LIDKVSKVLNRLGLREEDLDWVFRVAPTQGLIDLNRLPLEGREAGDFAGWRRLARAADLQAKEFQGRLFDLLVEAADGAGWDDPSFKSELASRTGWDPKELDSVCDHFAFRFPDHFKDERALVRIERTLASARKAGVKITLLTELADLPESLAERK